jgi:hypothetical protein
MPSQRRDRRAGDAAASRKYRVPDDQRATTGRGILAFAHHVERLREDLTGPRHDVFRLVGGGSAILV